MPAQACSDACAGSLWAQMCLPLTPHVCQQTGASSIPSNTQMASLTHTHFCLPFCCLPACLPAACRGFGIVRFPDKESADIAVNTMNNATIGGRVVSVRIDRFA
jgi:hypothetical protein